MTAFTGREAATTVTEDRGMEMKETPGSFYGRLESTGNGPLLGGAWIHVSSRFQRSEDARRWAEASVLAASK